MSDLAIKVENLSKQHLIGVQLPDSLSDKIFQTLPGLMLKTNGEFDYLKTPSWNITFRLLKTFLSILRMI